MTGYVLGALLPGALLIFAVPVWFRRARYGGFEIVFLSLLTLAQAGFFMTLLSAGQGLWLAVGIAALVGSASAFAEREDLRRVILFGGALAAVQFCDPSGALVAAGMLPAAFTLGVQREAPKATGLYAMLLFMPVMAAALLVYLVRTGNWLVLDPVRLPALGAAVHPNYVAVLAPGIVAAPALYLVRRTKAGRACFYVIAATIFAAGLAVWNGAVRRPAMILSTALPVVVAAIAVLPRAPGRQRRALVGTAASAGLSWLTFFLLGS